MDELDNRVAIVRRFSRFYTRRTGVLHEGLLGSPLSLTEGRVIWELAQRERATASELAAELGLDAGYLSRILAGFEEKGLIGRSPRNMMAGRPSSCSAQRAKHSTRQSVPARARRWRRCSASSTMPIRGGSSPPSRWPSSCWHRVGSPPARPTFCARPSRAILAGVSNAPAS